MLKRMVLLSGLFILVSINCQKKSPSESSGTSPLVGTWTIFSLTINGNPIDLNTTRRDFTRIIKFNKDGTGLYNAATSFTWSTTGDRLFLHLEGEDPVSATYSINNINILMIHYEIRDDEVWVETYQKQ